MESGRSASAPGRGIGAKALLISLRERIRLHQVGGLVDEIVLAVGTGAADARLAPEMMVLMDANVAFRRSLELDAGRGRCHLVDVERARLLYGELPQPRAQIGGLRDVADDDLVTHIFLNADTNDLLFGLSSDSKYFMQA